MYHTPNDVSAAERARLLSELSRALKEARCSLIELGISSERRAEALDLFIRIEAARLELQSLQLSRAVVLKQEPSQELGELLTCQLWPQRS
jgi:hypothetical protein